MTFITYYFENTCFFLIFAPTFFDIADKIVSYTTDRVASSVRCGCELLTKSYHIQTIAHWLPPESRCELLTKSYHIQR